MATFTTLLARELKEVSFNALKCEVEGSVIYNVRDQNRRLGESLIVDCSVRWRWWSPGRVMQRSGADINISDTQSSPN